MPNAPVGSTTAVALVASVILLRVCLATLHPGDSIQAKNPQNKANFDSRSGLSDGQGVGPFPTTPPVKFVDTFIAHSLCNQPYNSSTPAAECRVL